jgi:hypothetical protein
MSTKKLMLTASFLTPLLFAMAGAALAQDQQPPSSDDPAITAEQIENAEDVEPGDLNGVPAETPVLVQADETPEDPPPAPPPGFVPYNPPTYVPPQEPDWLPSANPPPGGTAHSWSEAVMEGGVCWVYLNTVITRTDGTSVFYYHKHREPCPPPVSTAVDDNPVSTAVGLLQGGLQDLTNGPPHDDQPPALVDPPKAPGVDWVKQGANGASYEHHTDGSMVIKDKDGKVTGMIAPPMTAAQTKQGLKTVDGHTDVPSKTGETGMKPRAGEEPTRVGTTNPGIKQATGSTGVAGHEQVSQHAVAVAPKPDTRAAAALQEMHKPEITSSRSMVTNGLGHMPAGESPISGLGHMPMGQSPISGLGHMAMGQSPISSLGHGPMGHSPMSLGPVGGLGHMGGLPGGGMHLGGFGMR